jgi:subtilisin family serine protease
MCIRDSDTYYAPLINMSVGGSSTNSIELKGLYDKMIIPVCAAGNDPSYVSFPGKNIYALCVSAIKKNDSKINNDTTYILDSYAGREQVKENIMVLYDSKFTTTYLEAGKYMYFKNNKYYDIYIAKPGNYYCYYYSTYQKYTNAYTDAVSNGNSIWSLNAKNDPKYTGDLIQMTGTSMATPQMTGICALILDALIKSYYLNQNKTIPTDPTILKKIQKSAAKYAYDMILFNHNYYTNIDEYVNPSDLDNNNSDINGSCGRGIINLKLIIDNIINKTLQIKLS